MREHGRPLSDLTRFQEQLYSIENLPNPLSCECSDEFPQLTLINREKLWHYHHALIEKVGLPRIKENISRCSGSHEIGCQGTDNNCVDATAIENVVLNNNMGMAVAGFGTNLRKRKSRYWYPGRFYLSCSSSLVAAMLPPM
jgi:hypothetical protein